MPEAIRRIASSCASQPSSARRYEGLFELTPLLLKTSPWPERFGSPMFRPWERTQPAKDFSAATSAGGYFELMFECFCWVGGFCVFLLEPELPPVGELPFELGVPPFGEPPVEPDGWVAPEAALGAAAELTLAYVTALVELVAVFALFDEPQALTAAHRTTAASGAPAARRRFRFGWVGMDTESPPLNDFHGA